MDLGVLYQRLIVDDDRVFKSIEALLRQLGLGMCIWILGWIEDAIGRVLL